MDVGAEHIRETRAKILAAKKEIKEYLRLPEEARGLLILTHGKGNVIFLNQENLPTGAERKYTWEESRTSGPPSRINSFLKIYIYIYIM